MLKKEKWREEKGIFWKTEQGRTKKKRKDRRREEKGPRIIPR